MKVSLAEAKSKGLTRYFTGEPCGKGHVVERYVSSRKCIECKKEYDKKGIYYRDNKEKILERTRKLYRDNKEKISKRVKRYRENNKEKISKRIKKYRENNREKIRKHHKEYQKHYHRNKPWKMLLYHARSRDPNSSLTEGWAVGRWIGKCEITGLQFQIGNNGCITALSPTIDRIDPSKSYTQDNCRFVVSCFNSFKGRMSDDELRNVIRILYESDWYYQ